MVLTTILRGFKVPVPLLDRFFAANGALPTFNQAPSYDRGIESTLHGPVDGQTALIRSRLGPDGQNTRIFMANRDHWDAATHAYIAYAFVNVFAQRGVDMEGELPGTLPGGVAALREEILGFVEAGEEGLVEVGGMEAGEGEDPAGRVFVVVSDRKVYSWRGPFLRRVSFGILLLFFSSLSLPFSLPLSLLASHFSSCFSSPLSSRFSKILLLFSFLPGLLVHWYLSRADMSVCK